jgi:arylsulfatase A-like enzyme
MTISTQNRSLVAIGLAVAVAAALVWTLGCGRSPRPHNVLVVTLDTMRADRLPAYGFSGVDTPALDRLAAQGVVFEQAFAAVPLTLPSHASLFTGLYPHHLNMRDNVASPLAPEFTTMAEVLRERGMATGAFVASGVLGPSRGLDQGFVVYSDAAGAGCGGRAPRARRAANDVVDETIAWLGEQRGSFFAWVHLYDTHRPYRLPDEYTGRYDNPYLDAIAFEDAQIGRLLDHLDSRRILDDTLVVIAGDHGESLGDHGEDSHGIFIYQEALHVPLIMRGPRLLPRRVSAVTRLVDVMPTVLDLFGERLPELDGVTLTSVFARPDADLELEVYAESLYSQRFGWSGLRSLRADRYKVIEAPRPELYDLFTDASEQRNIFDQKPHIAVAMLERLLKVGGPAGQTVGRHPGIDPAAAERVASLGYIGGSIDARPAAVSSAGDPKDHITTFNQMTTLQAQTAALLSRDAGACK